MRNIFYYGGKKYMRNTAALLCKGAAGIGTISLYISRGGEFFTIEETGWDNETLFKVVSKDEAFKFMDNHSDGIEIEQYNRIFGEPEEG